MKTDTAGDDANQRTMISEPVILELPIERGAEAIGELRFRRPQAGELRGLSIAALGQMQVDELRKLAPRISMPTITAEEFDRLDPADLMECSDRIMDFLLQKQRRAELPTT